MIRRAVTLGALVGLLGCGSAGEPVQVVSMTLSSTTQSLDPSLIDQVVVAVVQDADLQCVTSSGSNSCSALQSVTKAEQATGYKDKASITAADGSSLTFDGLARGQTCFVAEARALGGQPLALGCAEVELKLERHLVEITVTTTP